jgi:hypothetical protein
MRNPAKAINLGLQLVPQSIGELHFEAVADGCRVTSKREAIAVQAVYECLELGP